jgi:DNA-binding YbaB/EbfC family protein
MRPSGQFDLQDLLEQARHMQQGLLEAQADLAEMDVTGRAGHDLVSVTMSASGEYKSVVIDPSVVDPRDVETLEALVLTALRNAAATIREVAEAKLGPLTNSLGG